jgi:hypothetical protein
MFNYEKYITKFTRTRQIKAQQVGEYYSLTYIHRITNISECMAGIVQCLLGVVMRGS